MRTNHRNYSLLTLILISFVTIGWGQANGLISDTSYFDGCNWTTCSGGACQTTLLACSDTPIFDVDSLQAERFFIDSTGNQYMVNYTYADENNGYVIHSGSTHAHYVAICSIIKWKGNKSQIVMQNIKAIYSPTECSSDCTALWLKRLYEYQKSKK